MDQATTAQTPTQNPAAATAGQSALPLRGDTFLGVCEALGQDFGIPADLFRIVFAGLFFWNMGLAIAAYFGLGTVIAVSRWLFPVQDRATVLTDRTAAGEAEELQLPLAA